MINRAWQVAYAIVHRRKRNYQVALTSPAGQEVLVDIARFCRAFESCYHQNQRKTDILIGRHEVWLHIQNHLKLTPEQLLAIANGTGFNPNEPGEDDDRPDTPSAGTKSLGDYASSS